MRTSRKPNAGKANRSVIFETKEKIIEPIEEDKEKKKKKGNYKSE